MNNQNKQKFSYYNITLSIEGRHFVYNTLYGSLAKIDEKTKHIIDSGDILSLTPEQTNTLKSLGVIIDKDLEEKDYIAEKIKESKVLADRTHIFFTTTLACNCNCAYCFEGKNVKEEKSSYDWFVEFAKKALIKNNSDELLLDFFGGEPMLKWNKLIEIMEELIRFGKKEKKRILFRFYTNGTILNNKILSFLSEQKKYIKDLQITIDGPKEIHDKRRPLKIKRSAFDEIIKNINLLYKNNVPVKIRINVDKENVSETPKLLQDLKKYIWYRCIPIYFYRVQNLGETCSGYRSFLNDPQAGVEFKKLWTLALEQGFNITTKPNIKFVYCSSFNENSYVVDYKRNLYKCAILQSQKHAIGKITERGFVKITNEKELKNWMKRDSLKIPICKDCKFMPTCASGCGGSAYNKFGTHHINNCSGNKKIFIDNLELYIKKKYIENNHIL